MPSTTVALLHLLHATYIIAKCHHMEAIPYSYLVFSILWGWEYIRLIFSLGLAFSQKIYTRIQRVYICSKKRFQNTNMTSMKTYVAEALLMSTNNIRLSFRIRRKLALNRIMKIRTLHHYTERFFFSEGKQALIVHCKET